MDSSGATIRKTLVVGGLAITLLVLGVPAFMGWQLAKIHDRTVRQLAVPGLLEVRDTAFSRGILRSRSRIKSAAVDAFCGGTPCPEVVIDSTIHHGPIAFTAPPDTHGGLQIGRGVMVSQASLAGLFGETEFSPELPKLEAVTRVDLAGGTQSQWLLPGARLRAQGENIAGRIHLEPAQASAQIPASHDSLRANLNWPDFNFVADAGGQVGLQGLAVEFNGDEATPLFWQRLGVKLNQLQAVDAQGQSLLLQGLLWDADNTAVPGGKLASEFELRLSQLKAVNRGFGPVIIEGKVAGLDIAGLEAMQTQIRSLNTQALPPELLILAVSGIYQAYMPALLAGDPELEISRLLVGTPEGDIGADLRVGFAAAGASEDATDIASVLARLQLTVNLRLPAPYLRAWVRQNLEARRAPESPEITDQDIDDDIAALTSAQFILSQPEDHAFVTQIRIDKQRLVVNDEARDGWQEILEALESGVNSTKTSQKALQ